MNDAPKVDKAQMLLLVGACWLAFRGESPVKIAAQAARFAEGVGKLRDRIDSVMEAQVRAAVGCTGPGDGCLLCLEREREAAREQKARPS